MTPVTVPATRYHRAVSSQPAHLAQINVARLRAPLDDPVTAEFVDALQPVNALAEAAPGFVWRLQTEHGDATAIRAFEDQRMIVNLSVWTSLATLADYAYRSGHVAYLRRRREWFEERVEAHQALWWVARGHRPDVAEGLDRLARVRTRGPGPDAFTFREPYPSFPGRTPRRKPTQDRHPLPFR